ncbi:unnamed protein product, partial [Prunus brigantina]
MIFTDMYQHRFRLPFHPWVQMMLAKLGYASGQYNPNFWLLLHGVYIAWWLAGLGEPTFEQFMYLYSISKQQGTFGWVQANCRKTKETSYFIGHKPSTQKSWRNKWCLAYVRESRAKKAEKYGAQQANRKHPRDDNEGQVADVLGKRKTLEEARHSVMKTKPKLPPFNLEAPPKLPFGVKSDPEALARTLASSYADRAQKTILTYAYAFGEMYVNMAKADKEIQRLNRRDEMTKGKMAEAQEAIREKNNVLLKTAMAKKMEGLRRSKADEIAA